MIDMHVLGISTPYAEPWPPRMHNLIIVRAVLIGPLIK